MFLLRWLQQTLHLWAYRTAIGILLGLWALLGLWIWSRAHATHRLEERYCDAHIQALTRCNPLLSRNNFPKTLTKCEVLNRILPPKDRLP